MSELIDQWQLQNVSAAKIVAEPELPQFSWLDMKRFSRRDSFLDVLKTVIGDEPLAILAKDTNISVATLIESGQLQAEHSWTRRDKSGLTHRYTTSIHHVTKPVDGDEIVDFLAKYMANVVERTGELDRLMSKHRFEFLRAHLQVRDIDSWIQSINANLLALVYLTGVVCVDDMLMRYLGRTDVKVFIPRKPAKEGILGHGLATYLRHTTLPFLVQYVGCTSRATMVSSGDAAYTLARRLRLNNYYPIFVLDSGYGTFDLLHRLVLNGNQVLSAVSKTNMKGLASLLTMGLNYEQWRVFEGNYCGLRFLAYGWSTGDADRDILSLSTCYRVIRDRSSADVSNVTANSSVSLNAFSAQDVRLLSRVSATALKDLAGRLGLPVEGSASALAYRIAHYQEPEQVVDEIEPSSEGEKGGRKRKSAAADADEAKKRRFRAYQVDSIDQLDMLEINDDVLVYFDCSKEVYRGSVKEKDLSWPQPFGVAFPNEGELSWISLEEGVARLDDHGNINACTSDVGDILSDMVAPAAAAAEQEDKVDEDDNSQKLRALLQKKKVPQLIQLLSQIGIVPRTKEKKKQNLIEMYIRGKAKKSGNSENLTERLFDFFGPVGRGHPPPMHFDYKKYMSMIDHTDQSHSSAYCHHRVHGGSDRSFTLHLLIFLFLNARAAWEDLHGNGVLHQPKSVHYYINLLIDQCIERNSK